MESEVPKYVLRTTKEVRESFDSLGDSNKCKESITNILKFLSTTDLTLVKSAAASKGHPKKQSTTEYSEDVLYILKRLTRGIISSRTQCHEGYYTAITILLKSFLQLGPSLFSIFQESVGNDLKFEKESYNNKRLGCILFYGAVIRSGLWKEHTDIFNIVLNNLNKLMVISNSYDAIIGQFCIDLLAMSADEHISNSLYSVFKDSLNPAIENLSVGNLWIRIVLCRPQYYKHLNEVSTNFQTDLFKKENFTSIFFKLNELNRSGFNVDVILNDYFTSIMSHFGKEKGPETIVSCFNFTILTKFPLSTDHHKLRSFVYIVITAMIQHLNKCEQMQAVFCHSLMSEFLIKKNHLPEVASSFQNLINALSEKIIAYKDIENGELQISIIKRVIEPPMSILFDKISKSKFVQNAIENLHPTAIQSFTGILFEIMEKNRYETEKTVNGIGVFSGNFIATVFLISRCLSQSSMLHLNFIKWRINQITRLVINIFFRNHPKKEAIVLRDIFKKCFEYNSNKLEDHILYTDGIIKNINKHMKDENHCLKPDSLNCWNSIFISRVEIKKQAKGVESVNGHIFRLLYNEMCLSSLFDAGKTQDMFIDLDDCFQGMSAKGLQFDNENNTDFSEMVDLLLALLSKADHHWRRTIVMLFKNLCIHLKTSQLALITDIIDPSREGEFMFDDEESDAEEEMEDEEVESDDDSDGLNDDDESEEEISAKDQKEIKLLKLKEKMQILVGIPGDDIIDMDSAPQEELNSLDKSIGALMKSYLQLKKKNSKRRKIKLAKDETELMHFRIRVCDMLEAFIKVAPSVEHLAELIDPLLRATKNFSQHKLQQQLNKRLQSVLVDLSQAKKFVKDDSDAAAFIIEKLSSLFRTHKNHSIISKEIGYCCTFLIRSGLALCENSKSQKKQIINAYSQELSLLFTRQSSLLPVAFAGPLALESKRLGYVLETLTNCSFDKSFKSFGQIQASNLLIILLRNEKCVEKMSSKLFETQLQVICFSITEVFDALDDEKKVKATQLIAYFDIIKAVKGLSKRVEKVEQIFEWESLRTSLSNLNDRIDISKPKSLRNSVRAIAEVLNIQIKFKVAKQQPTKKEKLESLGIMDAEDEVESDEGDKENDKRKLINDIKKRKAERQLQKIEKKMRKKQMKQSEETDEDLNPEEIIAKEKVVQSKKVKKHERKKQKLWAKQNVLNNVLSMEPITFAESVEV